MSIIVGNDTKLVVSGLTGREGSFHGLRNRDYGTNVVAGTNSRLDTLQAAVLSIKLPHLDGWNAARRRHADAYDARSASRPSTAMRRF